MCRRPPLLRSEVVRRDSAGPTLAARSAGRTHGNTAVGSRISGAFWIAPRVGRRTHLYVSRRANNKDDRIEVRERRQQRTSGFR